jgi:putative DNA primase/helicase
MGKIEANFQNCPTPMGKIKTNFQNCLIVTAVVYALTIQAAHENFLDREQTLPTSQSATPICAAAELSGGAMIDPRSLARVLGGDVFGNTVRAPGPGHSLKDRSLAIKLDASAPDGFLVYSYSGDDWKTCRDHVRRCLGLPDWKPGDDESTRSIPGSRIEQWDLAAVEGEVAESGRPYTEDELIRMGSARRIWEEAKHPVGTLAEIYLRQHRKLDLPDMLCGTVLRFHLRCPWRNENTGKSEHVPALIAVFRSIDNDAITAVQRVRLNADGSKNDRRMLGIVHRAAIKFDPADERLCIGEGVETCMAARQLGFKPTWALGSAGAISFFPLIENVKKLTILGEAGEGSARAIQMVGKRWRKAGRRVRIVMPNSGSDLNDVLLARVVS